MQIHLDAAEAPQPIGALVHRGEGPALKFGSLPELIRWLALLELEQRRGPGGIR